MQITLCGEKGCCPVVKTTKIGASIGEAGNMVKLKANEWNMLVDVIKSGKLKKI